VASVGYIYKRNHLMPVQHLTALPFKGLVITGMGKCWNLENDRGPFWRL